VEAVEPDAEGALEDGAAAGAEEEDSLVDEAAGLSAGLAGVFAGSDFESDEASPEPDESVELLSELPELLGA
jgi:hypothetical protein